MSRSTFLGPHAVGILLALSASDSMGLTRILRPEPEMDPLLMLENIERHSRHHRMDDFGPRKSRKARKNRSKIKAARKQKHGKR